MSNLELRIKRPLRVLTRETDLSQWKTEASVIASMLKQSGLLDKTIAIETGIDPAVLSKAQSGQARLPEEKMDALMDATGSEAWLYYWMFKRGYDPRYMRRIESDLERENRELREQLELIQHEREVEARLYSRLRTH